MKTEILEELNDIPETDTSSLEKYTRSILKELTPYFHLGIDEEYYKELEDFRLQSRALLYSYDTPETHQTDDIYWLLYWATCDSSLIETFNGYNYLHLLLSPAVQDKLNQIRLKEYMKSIIKLIKAENLNH